MNIRQYYTGICLHHAPYFMIDNVKTILTEPGINRKYVYTEL